MTLKIIGTGLSRTGTMSLKDALETLTGEPCYHMHELFRNPERLPLWEEAEEKQQTDWDALFEGYGSAVDLPTTKYYAQLLEKYPDAKFVHIKRIATESGPQVRSPFHEIVEIVKFLQGGEAQNQLVLGDWCWSLMKKERNAS